METPASQEMRDLLQEFVDAQIDAPTLLARAGKLLPADADANQEILELLAEGNLKLRPPDGRRAFVLRLEQFAEGEVSYTDLDLWCFSLGLTGSFGPDAIPQNPELVLLRAVVDWIEKWEDEAERPAPAELHEFARILAQESDPLLCLERLQEALARFERN